MWISESVEAEVKNKALSISWFMRVLDLADSECGFEDPKNAPAYISFFVLH